MKNLIFSALFFFRIRSLAQQDSSTVVFGYPDSTKIKVEIDLEDPLQDIHPIIFGGIGTIGSADASALALNLEYYVPFNVNSSATFRLVSSFQDFSNSGVLLLEGVTHTSLISKVGKANMKLKLNSTSNRGEQVYYASYPFAVRHQLMLDAGFNIQELRKDLELNSLQEPAEYIRVNSRRFVNGLIGASYVRTRNVALTVNETKQLHFLTKFKAGVNLGLGLSGGADVDKVDLLDTLTEVQSEDYGDTKLSKIGLGFDIGYQYETIKPGWVVSFDLLGRFVPNYRGEAHFYEFGIYENKPDYVYNSNLMILPSISIGYILN